MKSTKKKTLSFNVELTDGSNLEDSMLCGNKSVSLNQTLSPSIAENFLCCVCHGVPTETPLVSICCEAIYCSECFHSWKQISNTCFRSCYGECNKLLSKQGAKQIEGFYQKVWSQLMTICNVCGNKIELSETLFHDFKCHKRECSGPREKKVCFDINRLGKRDSGYSYKKIRSTVQPLLDVAEKVKQDISSENPDICDLEVILGAALSLTNNTDLKAVRFSILQAVSELKGDSQNYKLTIEEISCLRKLCNFSVSATNTMIKTLNVYKQTTKLSNHRPYLNVFSNYKYWHKADLAALPPNVHYFLLKKDEPGVVLKEHLADLSGKPEDFLEEYKKTKYAFEEPVPNVEGCFFHMDDILAKELSSMAQFLKDKLSSLGVTDVLSHVLSVQVLNFCITF